MIDKILFDKPIKWGEFNAYGIIVTIPYPENKVIRIQALNFENKAQRGLYLDIPAKHANKLKNIFFSAYKELRKGNVDK